MTVLHLRVVCVDVCTRQRDRVKQRTKSDSDGENHCRHQHTHMNTHTLSLSLFLCLSLSLSHTHSQSSHIVSSQIKSAADVIEYIIPLVFNRSFGNHPGGSQQSASANPTLILKRERHGRETTCFPQQQNTTATPLDDAKRLLFRLAEDDGASVAGNCVGRPLLWLLSRQSLSKRLLELNRQQAAIRRCV
jgi:hypothetical protein